MAAAVNGRMAVYVLLGPIGGVVWFVGPALGAVIVATAGARVAFIANGHVPALRLVHLAHERAGGPPRASTTLVKQTSRERARFAASPRHHGGAEPPRSHRPHTLDRCGAFRLRRPTGGAGPRGLRPDDDRYRPNFGGDVGTPGSASPSAKRDQVEHLEAATRQADQSVVLQLLQDAIGRRSRSAGHRRDVVLSQRHVHRAVAVGVQVG